MLSNMEDLQKTYRRMSSTDDAVLNAHNAVEQGNHRYQTLPAVCNRTLNSIYFLNLSPINTKLSLLSYVRQYIFVSSAMYTYRSNHDIGVVHIRNFCH